MPATHFGAKLEAWRQKKVQILHCLQSDMVFVIVNPFSWKANAIYSARETLPDFNEFPVNLHRRQDSKVFPDC